jgi:hypothetical protein
MGMPGRHVSSADAIPALRDLVGRSKARSRPTTTAKPRQPPVAVVTPRQVTSVKKGTAPKPAAKLTAKKQAHVAKTAKQPAKPAKSTKATKSTKRVR